MKDVIIRRLYGIGVPYLLWAALYDAHNIKSIAYLLWGTNQSLSKAHSSGVLWFLPAFLVAVIIFETIIYFTGNDWKKNFAIGTTFFLMAYICFEFNIKGLPWGLDIALLAVVYMIIGYRIRYYFDNRENNKKNAKFIHPVLCIIGLSSGLLVHNLPTVKGCTQMANADYGNIILFFIAGCGVPLGIFYIMKKMNECSKLQGVNKVIRKVGVNSLLIMILHRDFVVYYNAIISRMGLENSNVIALIYCLLVVAITYFMSLLVVRFVPILAGKR